MNIRKFLFVFVVFFSFLSTKNSFADLPFYLDYKYVLNQSVAGKKAQDDLKKKLNKGIESIKIKEKNLQEEEKQIIQQKKIISAEEYKKKIIELRKKVTSLQLERNKLLDNTAKQRAKAKNKLLKNLNPIIKEYMTNNNIKMIIDKKYLVMSDESLDITQKIVDLLNKKLKSIKLN